MKKHLLILCLALPFFGLTQLTKEFVVYPTGNNGAPERIQYLQFLPPGYTPAGAYKHPVIIFLHGNQGTAGGPGDTANLNSLDRVISDAGLPSYLNSGATMEFSTSHGPESFIVLMPQKRFDEFSPGLQKQFPSYYIDAMLQEAYALNSDPTRVFLTGFSLGAGQVWDYPNYSAANARRIAGIVPISGQPVDAEHPAGTFNLCTMAANGVDVRAYTAQSDPFEFNANLAVASYNQCPVKDTAAVLETTQGFGFSAAGQEDDSLAHRPKYWNYIYNPAYCCPSPYYYDPAHTYFLGPAYGSVNNPPSSMNIYQWMLSRAPQAAGGALPVDFIYVKGKNLGQANIINWATSREINFARFEILRSADGKNYLPIGTISSSTNSSIKKEYSFKDDNAPKGTSYYQIKQIDKDFKFKLTKVVTINNINALFVVEKYPNPVVDKLNLVIDGKLFGRLEIQVVDFQGKIVQRMLIRKDDSNWKGSLNVSNLSKGIYNLRLQTEKGVNYNSTFIK